MPDDYPHFKDFAQQDKGPLEGEKKKIAEILNKEISNQEEQNQRW